MLSTSCKVGILGLGYTAQFFAQFLNQKGVEVIATSRSLKKRQQSTTQGLTLVDYTPQKITELLASCDYLLSTIPPTSHSIEKSLIDPVIRQFYDEIASNQNHLKWLGYLSSTSVYGDHHGHWVDETTPVNNPGESGIKRLEAEREWLSMFHQDGLPVHIFRLAGIYGPGRNAIEKLRQGKTQTIHKPGQYFSRIMVDDISNALWRSMNHLTPGQCFNVCDDAPASSEEVDQYAAKLLQLPPLAPIPINHVTLSPMGREFYQSNKRVSNEKIKKVLGFSLQYPSYREGLKALVSI